MALSQLVSLCEIMIFSVDSGTVCVYCQKCDYEINSSTPFSPFQHKIDKVIHNSFTILAHHCAFSFSGLCHALSTHVFSIVDIMRNEVKNEE